MIQIYKLTSQSAMKLPVSYIYPFTLSYSEPNLPRDFSVGRSHNYLPL